MSRIDDCHITERENDGTGRPPRKREVKSEKSKVPTARENESLNLFGQTRGSAPTSQLLNFISPTLPDSGATGARVPGRRPTHSRSRKPQR